MKRNLLMTALLAGIFPWTALSAAKETIPPYRDVSQPIEARVKDLLSRMTLGEKLGQLNIPCVYKPELGGQRPPKLDRVFDEGTDFSQIVEFRRKREAVRQFVLGQIPDFEHLGPGGGLFGLANSALPEDPKVKAEFYNDLQRLALEETRLGIPLLHVEEGTHGVMASYATIFPEGLTLGSTWNVDLIQKVYATVAREGRAFGAHAFCTLVIEPDIDPRMGRNAECYSEDPYLCSEFARAIVRGIQGDDVSAEDKGIAVLCHFPGQSQGFAGLEFNAMEMSERAFRNVFLPPWEAGIRDERALMTMATHPSFDILGGVPAHASREILTDLLRGELNFRGVVLGEGNSVRTILWKKVCETQKQAGKLALDAGLDVSISLESGFMQDMFAGVQDGTISLKEIDLAVARVLTLKFMLGLFEQPYVDVARARRVTHTKRDEALALQAAREGVVLLKNDNKVLPLRKDLQSVAVIGPLADAPEDQLGDYTPRFIRHNIVTPLAGIKAAVGSHTKVTYVKGVEILNPEFDEIQKAVQAAKKADVALLFVGESSDCYGEKNDVASLDLLGRQRELIQAVHATGTPTIVILINSRPLTINWTAKHVPAILNAGLMGEMGGHAVADVLFGNFNPCGRLAITFPQHAGQLPAVYFFKPSKEQRRNPGRRSTAYVDMSMDPIFEFGYGLSYTTFKYSNLRIAPRKGGPEGVVIVSCDVTNGGSVAGDEVVQLYVNDVISSVTTPIRQLKGFRKIHLEPGETKTVTMPLRSYDLSLLDRHLERVVEPGLFDVMVGASCDRIKLRGQFEIMPTS